MGNQDGKYFVKSITGETLTVYEDRLVIGQKGVLGTIRNGFAGNKTYYFKDISAVQFKNCGWTAGYLELSFPGATNNGGGVFSGDMNVNRFNFGAPTIGKAKKLAATMQDVYDFIMQKIAEAKSDAPKNIIAQPVSVADELLKLKELFDNGILTEAEFEQQKNKILNA